MGACCSAEENRSQNVIHRSENVIQEGEDSSGNDSVGPTTNFKIFGYSELKEATRSFDNDNMLGQGNVFKGWIDKQSLEPAPPETGMAIAVKMLNKHGFEGLEELVTELKFLGQLRHPNLVKLIGYCSENDHRLLVYEFMPLGSLDRHIFRSSSSIQPLSWNRRMKIALGVAEGLAFLHNTGVIYRDLKSSDVLLDSNYNAKLSDLGWAKDAPRDGRTHVSTRVLGTEGYSAPEYMRTGHLTVQSDVYSFGVVFLEMLSGKQVIDRTRPSREQILVEWALPYLRSTRSSGKSFRVLDDNISNEVKDKYNAVQKSFNLASACLSTNPKGRPNMKIVVEVLEQLHDPNEK